MVKKYKIDADGTLMPELRLHLSGTENNPKSIPNDDELLRKSKQLSRLTAERFARIEDRLDKLENQ